MRLRLGACTRYLPRLLTVVVFCTVAGLLVLANLSDEMTKRAKTPADLLEVQPFDLAEPDPADVGMGTYPFWNLSYGWPLLWNQYICAFTGGPSGITDWCYSAARLAIDMAAWLVMLAAPTAACEWLLRRYRPRLRWSLRTMLAAVGLFAVICACFATARKRAELQEPIIASDRTVWVERWGPRWLEVVGVEPLCRRIVGVDVPDEEHAEEVLQQLDELPDLQYLSIEVSKLTPSMAAAFGELRQLPALSIRVNELAPDMGESLATALRGMRRLRVLSIEDNSGPNGQYENQAWHEILAAIGNATQLKSVWLDLGMIDSTSLGCLAGLTNLESLSIDFSIDQPGERRSGQSPLAHLPPLPRLATLELATPHVGDEDLGYLAILPSLKSLSIRSNRVTGAGLAELAHVQSLEELTIDRDTVSAAAFDALHDVKGLKTVHLWQDFLGVRNLTGSIALDDGEKLCVAEEDVSALVSAIDALRISHPGITINAGVIALESPEAPMESSKFEAIPDSPRSLGLRFLHEWQEGRGELQRFIGSPQ